MCFYRSDEFSLGGVRRYENFRMAVKVAYAFSLTLTAILKFLFRLAQIQAKTHRNV